MGLSIFEETFGKERVRFGKVSKREASAEHLVAITEAVQKVVDTFRDPRTGQRFVVALSSATEAYSDPDAKRIVVSYKPIYDKGLKVSTVCTVMTGLVLHEIGHTLYTFPNHPAIEAAFGKAGEYTGLGYYDRKKAWDQLAYTMLNIGDDARLEARMTEALPIAAGIFPTMLHWVAVSTEMVNEPFRWKGKALSMSDRVNFAGRSIRYPWTATWSNDQHTRDERLWWQGWGREYIALDDHDTDGMVRLLKVATARLRNPEDLDFDKEPPPDGPKGNRPGGQSGIEDEDEDEPQPKGESKPPFGDDFDKDESDDEDDDDEDEDADDDEQDESDEDEPEPDDEGGYESEPEEDADDDEQDPDEDKPKGGSKTDGPSTDDGEGKGKEGEPDGEGKTGDGEQAKPDDSKPGGFPDDFDAHDLKGNVDAINNPTDWRTSQEGALVQKVLDGERVTERVNTGKWGTAKVEVRSIAQIAERRSYY